MPNKNRDPTYAMSGVSSFQNSNSNESTYPADEHAGLCPVDQADETPTRSNPPPISDQPLHAGPARCILGPKARILN